MVYGRPKKPHHKVRTGCVTCKKRRIKCDETKPECQQCTESSRKCEGYNPPRTWLFQPTRAVQSKQEQYVSLKTPASLVQLETPTEQRAFQFFIERTLPILSAYFGRSFWSITVPQITLHQPVIKHIVVSLSSVTEAIDFHNDEPTNDHVFQSNYTKALRCLTGDRKTPPTDTMLMACILFACLDFIRGEMGSGMKHVQAGLNMLDEWYRTKNRTLRDNSSTASSIHGIAPLFKPYLEKARTYGVSNLQFESLSLLDSPLELTYIPKTFSCVQEARHAADGLSHHLVTIIDSNERNDDTKDLACQVKDLLQAYRVALDSFNAQARPYTRARFERIIQLLKVHNSTMEMLLHAWKYHDLGCKASPLVGFKRILEYFDELRECWDEEHPEMMFAPSRSLMFHSGYIPPLFFTATSCPDPQIRERALQHLRWLHVQESNWTSCVAHNVALAVTTISLKATPLQCCSKDVAQQYPVYIKQITYCSLETAQIHYSCAECRADASHFETLPLDLSSLTCLAKVRWPLDRIVRVAGYQGGIAPLPSGCSCFLSTPAISPEEAFLPHSRTEHEIVKSRRHQQSNLTLKRDENCSG